MNDKVKVQYMLNIIYQNKFSTCIKNIKLINKIMLKKGSSSLSSQNNTLKNKVITYVDRYTYKFWP